jgi:hypothetical protein
MKTFNEEIDEMIEIAIKLTWNYTIFCALFEKNESDRETRGAHPEFFITMSESLFCWFCVSTSVLFNEKEKSTSICNLIKEVAESKPEAAEKLNAKICANRQEIDKLEKIRNQVCAHRWEKKTAQDVYDEVRLRVSMMKPVVDLVRPVILELAEITDSEKRLNLERQQFSGTTLQCVANDARQVMRAFAES